MQSEKIEALIEAFKENSDINSIFGKNIAYSSFFKDLEELGLLIQPIFNKKRGCYENSLIQIQIIDSKKGNTRIQLKKYMEVVEDFLNGKLKDFGDFKTLAVVDTGDEAILLNNKDKLVFTKRFEFYF